MSNPFLLGAAVEPGMFKNILLSGVSLNITNAADVSKIDANGYPKAGATLTAAYSTSLKFASNTSAATIYVLKGTGKCDFWLSRGSPGFTVVSDANSVVNGSAAFNLRITNTNPALSWRVTFQFVTSVPTSLTFGFLNAFAFDGSLSGLVLCRASDESAIAAATKPDDYFADDYVAAYAALGPTIIRPMGWSGPNSGNVSMAAYVAPWQTSLNISSQRYDPNAIASTDTGATVNTYTCGLQPDASNSANGLNPSTYTQGEMIHVQVLTANTVATGITLNSGGRGAVPILIGFGQNTGLNPAISGSQQVNVGWHTFTYDAVIGCFWWQGQQIAQTPCIPYELQAGFANRLGADLWINFHSQMSEATMVAITQKVDQYLAPGKTIYPEYGNEIWNNGDPATKMSIKRGAALGLTSTGSGREFQSWYGLQVRRVMPQIASASMTRSRSLIKCVMALQLHGSTSETQTYRFGGADLAPSGTHTGKGNAAYVTFDGGDYTQAGNQPIDKCDVFSYATYYGGAQTVQFDATYTSNFSGGLNINGLTAAADQYALGDTANQAAAIAWLDGDIRAGLQSNSVLGPETLAGNKTNMSALETIFATYGKTVVCYEGGSGCIAPSTASCTTLGISTTYGGIGGKIDNLITAWKSSSKGCLTDRQAIDDFLSYAHSAVPARLQLNGVSGSASATANPWCMNAGDSFASHYQTWYACNLYINGKRRLVAST